MGILRTIFAISVVFAHSTWRNGFVFVGGRNAVQLFYVISGFLISYVLNNNFAYVSPKRFYKSRALRLYPIYYLVALLSLFVLLLINPSFAEMYRRLPGPAVILLILSNLLLFGQDWIMFSAVKNGALVFSADFRDSDIELWKGLLVPQGWTLGVELSFYLIAPFILRDRRKIILLLGASVALRIYLIKAGIGLRDPWTYRFFPLELALFLVGALAQQILLPAWKYLLREKQWAINGATYFLIGLSVFYFLIPISDKRLAPFLFAVFVPLFPITFLYQNANVFDRKIGELSYPIYISHLLVIWVLEFCFVKIRFENQFLIAVINVVGTLIVAAILNATVAKRIERFRSKVKAPNRNIKH